MELITNEFVNLFYIKCKQNTPEEKLIVEAMNDLTVKLKQLPHKPDVQMSQCRTTSFTGTPEVLVNLIREVINTNTKEKTCDAFDLLSGNASQGLTD